MVRWLVIFLFLCATVKAQTVALPGANMGFESSALGSYTAANSVTGWTLSSATASNCNQYTFVPGASEFSSVGTPMFSHPIIGTIPNSPLGGTVVALLNAMSTNSSVTRIAQTVTVPTSGNFQFSLAYAGVWQDGGHACCAQAKLNLVLRDSAMQVINCMYFDLGGAGCTLSASSNTVIGNLTYCNWKTVSLYLGMFAGQKITIEIINSDCGMGDHYGSVYVDCAITPLSNLNLPICPVLNYQPILFCPNSPTIALSTWYTGTFTWTAPQGYTLSATQATTSPLIIQNPVSGSVFSLSINHNCLATTYTIQADTISLLGFGTSSTCVGGTIGSATIGLSGPLVPYSYTYTGTNTTIVTTQSCVSNLAAGFYTVTATTASNAGCGAVTQTFQIGQQAVVFNTTYHLFCNGVTSTTINRPGGLNYQWYNNNTLIPSPVGTASALAVNSPSHTQSIRLRYTSPQGCKDSSHIILYVHNPGLLMQKSLVSPCANQSNGTAVFGFTPSAQNTFYYKFVNSPTGSVTTGQSSLSTSSTSFVANNLSAGIYSFTAYDTACVYHYTYAVQQASLSYFLSMVRDTICSGANRSVGAIVPNAPNGTYTFSWSPTTFLFNNNGQLQYTIITPTVAANSSLSIIYTVAVTPTINTCVFTQTCEIVAVNLPTPTLAPLPATLCVNAPTLQLQGTPAGGYYTASVLNGFSSSGVFNPSQVNAGRHHFSYNLKKGNCIVKDTASIELLRTTFTVPSQNSICIGQSTTVCAQGAQTYTWSTGSNDSLIVVNPTTTTTYSVTGMNGVCPVTQTTTVIVVALPTLAVVAPTAICLYETTTLSVIGQGIFTWWNIGNTPTLVVSPTVTTHYTIIATGVAGCTNTLNTTLAVVVCDGMKEINQTTFRAYIDFNQQLVIEALGLGAGDAQVNIFDLQGRLIHCSSLVDGIRQFDFTNVSHGWYVVEVETGSGERLRRKVGY